jgi:signal transduction histidine kinase
MRNTRFARIIGRVMSSPEQEVALHETELFRSRVRAGMVVWLGAGLLFILSDLWLEPVRSVGLWVARGANVGALAALVYLRKPRSRRQVETVALLIVLLGVAVLSLSAAVVPDPAAALILLSVMVLGSATVLPWRFVCQVIVVVASCLSLAVAIAFATGSLASYVAQPMLGVFVAFAASLFIAKVLAAQRRATNEAMLSVARLVGELEEANRFQGDFLANMSHELRTPLNVIIGYCEMLVDGAFGSVNAEQGATIRHLSRAAQGQLDLISATLQLSRSESGETALETADVDLALFLEEIEREAGLMASSAGLAFEWRAARTPACVRTDAVKLKMVLKNLIDNAIKFTDRGGVTVRVDRLGDGVEFAVEDTGPGIPVEALETIFEAFRQHDCPQTRGRGGVGIGLYIVKRLVEALGGTVAVDSELGRGTEFRVWIPAPAVSCDESPSPLRRTA